MNFGHCRISYRSAFNRRSLNSAPWRARAHACACINARTWNSWMVSNLKAVRRRRRGGNFGPRGLNSLLVVELTPRSRQRKFSPESRLLFVSRLSLFLSLPFALPLPRSSETISSGTHHTTHSGKGLYIATGPGNISFRKITGSRRGCQCIKQTSLRQPYT